MRVFFLFLFLFVKRSLFKINECGHTNARKERKRELSRYRILGALVMQEEKLFCPGKRIQEEER